MLFYRCLTYDAEMGDHFNIFSRGNKLNIKNIKIQIITELEIYDCGLDKDMKYINLENAKVYHKT